MLPLIGALTSILRGSAGLASLGSREALIRVSSIGLRQTFTRGGVSRAMAKATTFARDLRKMDVEAWTSALDIMATLYLIASELFPDATSQENEARVVNFATSDKLLGYAAVAHTWALSDEGKDKAEEVYDALNDLFTEVENADMQAIMNVLVAPHLPQIRAAGFLFNLPYVNERTFWWDALARSDEGVDTAGLTSAEILFFGKVIFGFLGTEESVFDEEDQRLWSQPSFVDSGADSATVRSIRSQIERTFRADEAFVLNQILDTAVKG